eukprot:TRINITY_DN4191_c0_g1_i1.p1 TRINITY_DN4191_c0_g1~~TRINITY_DN4191_c0_g1_i1.p1  ORF type:complete len:298 (+),score=16.16 TRINITY_DN4191_c0_g1_i1:402-1295(+)
MARYSSDRSFDATDLEPPPSHSNDGLRHCPVPGCRASGTFQPRLGHLELSCGHVAHSMLSLNNGPLQEYVVCVLCDHDPIHLQTCRRLRGRFLRSSGSHRDKLRKHLCQVHTNAAGDLQRRAGSQRAGPSCETEQFVEVPDHIATARSPESATTLDVLTTTHKRSRETIPVSVDVDRRNKAFAHSQDSLDAYGDWCMAPPDLSLEVPVNAGCGVRTFPPGQSSPTDLPFKHVPGPGPSTTAADLWDVLNSAELERCCADIFLSGASPADRGGLLRQCESDPFHMNVDSVLTHLPPFL